MADDDDTAIAANATRPRLNNDPALAMATIWHRDRDELDHTLKLASQREGELIGVPPDQKDEARRLFEAAADVAIRREAQLELMTGALFKTRAQSFEGAVAKLGVAMRDGMPGPDSDEAPWPHLRSVYEDLERLQAAAADAARAQASQEGG